MAAFRRRAIGDLEDGMTPDAEVATASARGKTAGQLAGPAETILIAHACRGGSANETDTVQHAVLSH